MALKPCIRMGDDLTMPIHVGTDAVPGTERLKDMKQKSAHLIKAEKIAKDAIAPKVIRELACKELRQDAHLRSNKNPGSLVSTTPFQSDNSVTDLYRICLATMSSKQSCCRAARI